MRGGVRAAALAVAFCMAAVTAAAQPSAPTVVIPPPPTGATRAITTGDLVRLRDIDSLRVSPDGERFAILVRQADPAANAYRTAWYVGRTTGGPLVFVGDGGETRLLTGPDGGQTGGLGGSVVRWSPDGRTIAYMIQREGEVQLWSSDADGGGQRQLSRNAADVRDFAWSGDGRRLMFKVGSTRAALAAQAEAQERSGHLLQSFTALLNAVNPGVPVRPLETQLTTWVVGSDGTGERPADAAEQAALVEIERRQSDPHRGGVEVNNRAITAALRPPVVSARGDTAWLERDDPERNGFMPVARLRAARAGGPPSTCPDSRCVGQFVNQLWWRNGGEVVFWSLDGPTDFRHSIYAWTPGAATARTILSTSEHQLRSCDLAGDRLLCVRETPLEPGYVAAIDLATGEVAKVGDVNPEFAGLRLGRTERIEWDTAPDVARMGYPPRASGIILYPPDYDPRRTYPLFVAPYVSGGFLRGDVGDEQPLLVYAANGFIVLNSGFPHAVRALVEGDRAVIARRAWDRAFGYPHLTMLAETTFLGMDTAMTRARIDPQRIGIGGVSHGAFVPLHMVQKRDRFAALSVSQGSWNDGHHDYSALPFPYGQQADTPYPKDPDYWTPIDLSQHLDTIEAPILFHTPARELTLLVELVGRMSRARMPFEAYSFNDETHLKWQPAHRQAIYDRNLDWFRFWLQDVEDPDPGKAEQYGRWRRLRELQCGNPRSTRDYCSVVSSAASPAR